MMTSYERVFAALDHRTPDRCPVDVWTTPEVDRRLEEYFGVNTPEEILDKLESDLQFVHVRPLRQEVIRFDDGSFLDRNGVRVKNVSNEFNTYQERMEAPLAGAQCVADLEAWDMWPDADALDYEHFVEQIAPYAEKRVLKLFTGGIFETAISMRGYEQFMMDMALQPEIPNYIMGRITDYLIKMVQNVCKTPANDLIPIIYTYDDIAAQNTLLCSPAMLNEMVYPCHRRYNAEIKKLNKIILFHSCGAVYDEIANLRDLPIDVLNPLQPRAKDMDFQKIKDIYGKQLSFHGGICIQETLPHGTPDQVREEVRRAIRILGKDGGYIMTSAHHMQNDIPTENILAMYETELRYQ